MSKNDEPAIPVERISGLILVMRARRVMLDFDLAELYGVKTSAVNQAVTRNRERFPDDFMFRLSREEVEVLNRSQTVIGSQKHRDPRFPPRAFTQEGIAMLSSVLRSSRAVQVNIAIMRAFIELRRLLATHRQLARRLDELEKRCDSQLHAIFEAIRQTMTGGRQPPGKIGFLRATPQEAGQTEKCDAVDRGSARQRRPARL